MTTYQATFHTENASCPSCLARNGKPLPPGTGNISRVEMGHQMYHTASGRTAACALPSPGAVLAALRKAHAYTCVVCGETFESPAGTRYGKPMYCGNRCKQTAYRARQKEQPHA